MITLRKLFDARNKAFLELAETWKAKVAEAVSNLEKTVIGAAEQGGYSYTLITIPPDLDGYFICREYARKEFRKVIAPDIAISDEVGKLVIYW